jgi:hypothetical protein
MRVLTAETACSSKDYRGWQTSRRNGGIGVTEIILPEQFADLLRFVAKWDKPGTAERYAVRLASTMEELQDFHDALLPRMAVIRAYLDGKSFDAYSDADRRLGRLAFAWISAAEAVEVFKQPRVPDSKGYWDVRAEPDL